MLSTLDKFTINCIILMVIIMVDNVEALITNYPVIGLVAYCILLSPFIYLGFFKYTDVHLQGVKTLLAAICALMSFNIAFLLYGNIIIHADWNDYFYISIVVINILIIMLIISILRKCTVKAIFRMIYYILLLLIPSTLIALLLNQIYTHTKVSILAILAGVCAVSIVIFIRHFGSLKKKRAAVKSSIEDDA